MPIKSDPLLSALMQLLVAVEYGFTPELIKKFAAMAREEADKEWHARLKS